MKFTRKTDYALRALQYLARRGEVEGADVTKPVPVPVPVIAAETGLSLRFLSGIMATLSRHKVIRAVPGPKGGVSLARPPEAISILEVVEAVEGPINLMDCMAHPGSCSDASDCTIVGVLGTAQAAMRNSLRQSNLRLMLRAKTAPFQQLPEGHYLSPQFGCPVLK